MATALSEDVLLVVSHVRHKKRDGSLYLMTERIGWMEGSRQMFSISHLYADIKMQKISTEGKAKVQLQLILHDGGANTFHFANAERTSALKDRNDVKELLQQLLPKFKTKANKELEEKNRMLQEDPELFQLYKDLVMSGVISADEFWANRTVNSTGSQNTQHQDVGVSAAFLADIKPQTDGCNGLRYNLTADIIESIFRTYPAVKKKHAENVPDNMSESEFWTRFFQSHYFHRDRINAGNKDLFTDCAKIDEKEMKKVVNERLDDPLLDLSGMSDSSFGEGYGVGAKDSKSSGNISNTNLIKRFNHHNTRVLGVSEKAGTSIQSSSIESQPSTSTGSSLPNKNNSHIANNQSNGRNISSVNSNTTQDETVPSKRMRIKEAIEYEDLVPETRPPAVMLNLDKAERYHHGPMPVSKMDYATTEEMINATQVIREDMAQAKPTLFQTIHGSVASSVVSELSPGGSLMHGLGQQPLHQLYSQDIQVEMKNMYSALCELLRHFWSCFPVSSKFLEEKVTRMKINLERFQTSKLQPFREKLAMQHFNVNLINHMEELLETAYGKFTSWQARRMGSIVR
ncbi:general transcription factor IIH subunit 1 [Saccoglossus kowalevskii]|uniref:General transcription factor IIH subunit 1 n=1 Tax=Saccoglossus kowalevskii TaxID=10224 RepID=A0ABM0M4E8_SACKO|nr:PREDICTED: general transcription factor IIH subunit 1 [Saccoglossus kowalevskii]